MTADSSSAASAPAATWEQALASLTAPGAAFELVDGTIRGVPVKLFRNAPPSLREFVAAARTKGDATWLVYENERWSFADGLARVVIAAIKARLRDLSHDSGPAEEPSEAL